MTYEIEFSSKSKKFIKNLEKEDKSRVLDKFEEIKENPFRYLEHYAGDSCFKLRIGDFRFLIEVNFRRKILFVRVADKRGRIYII